MARVSRKDEAARIFLKQVRKRGLMAVAHLGFRRW
jgi:hypothetical protein